MFHCINCGKTTERTQDDLPCGDERCSHEWEPDQQPLRYRTKDHPEANGRKPQTGESQWTAIFPLENGDVLHVSMGRKGRDLLFGMLIADCSDSGETEPA